MGMRGVRLGWVFRQETSWEFGHWDLVLGVLFLCGLLLDEWIVVVLEPYR